MKVLLTGATGYIGKRLLLALLQKGCDVVCLMRDPSRLSIEERDRKAVALIKGDLLDPKSLDNIPPDIDVAYYLVHSMSTSLKDFPKLESDSAQNFIQALEKTKCRQVIYLSGLTHSGDLSPHLQSRKNVEMILNQSRIPLTTLHASIIIGSGSASFEIMRDLVEKLPIMVAPRWVKCLCQPIAIYDVIDYLSQIALMKEAFGKSYDIGGPDILSYKEMLLELAAVRHLKRWIITIPLLTPHLSSLWLCFITRANFKLARALVESLKNDTLCENRDIDKIIPKKCLSYREALERAFSQLEENAIISSWKDAWSASRLTPELSAYIQIPKQGCFVDKQREEIKGNPQEALERLFSIGGEKGWYYMNWAWHLRGLFDQLVGGVGLRRGRTNISQINVGDALDFWRVIFVDKVHGRLVLFAEMKLPGEAWLEFTLEKEAERSFLIQRAIFRPRGLAGRLYWVALFPFHLFIFKGMCRAIARG